MPNNISCREMAGITIACDESEADLFQSEAEATWGREGGGGDVGGGSGDVWGGGGDVGGGGRVRLCSRESDRAQRDRCRNVGQPQHSGCVISDPWLTPGDPGACSSPPRKSSQISVM